MCGRYALRATKKAIAEAFDTDVAGVDDMTPRYNVTPTQRVAVIRLDPDSGGRSLSWLRWGLVPSWAKDRKIASSLLNARAETVDSKPAFRSAFKVRRCLLVADRFFEWKAVGKGKLPHFIRLKTDRPFAVAGLWERWSEAPGTA